MAIENGFYCAPDALKGREVPDLLSSGGVYEPTTLGLRVRISRRGGDAITGATFIGNFLPALSEALAPAFTGSSQIQWRIRPHCLPYG